MKQQDLLLPLSAEIADAPSADSSGIQPHAQAMSVSEITAKIKANLENDFMKVWIKGEISNLKPASSAHAYFSLKDEGASLSAAAFGWAKKKKGDFELKDGQEVLCHGSISVYPPRGNYQLLVDAIEPLGAGALQLAFEQLKEKLQKEGLFDRTKKRPLPKYPSTIVVITSPQAAALKDVLTVLKRRAPFVKVILVPSLVQGEEAPKKLIQAIRVANHYRLGDVILLTRGGGSMEDLWCFNNEELVRSIAASHLPIVSAVGHEVDFTISDFVADLRAPTPSAGAEQLTSYWVELRERTIQLSHRMHQTLKRDLVLKTRTLQLLSAKLKSPQDRLREQSQRCDELSMALERHLRLLLERSKSRLDRAISHLNALSPLQVLSRGYALVQSDASDQDPVVIRSAAQAKDHEMLRLRFSDGEIRVRTESI
jgi:exodeoxyribonuclease VII large subunit